MTETEKFFENHVLEYYTERQLLTQYLYMNNGGRVARYDAAMRMAEGGCFLCYHYEIEDLCEKHKGLFSKRSTIENKWKSYCTCVAKACVRILDKQVIEPGEVYSIAQVVLYEGFIDYHESDLYLKKNSVSDQIVTFIKNKALFSTFNASDGSGLWYEFPFCYTPYWENIPRSEKVPDTLGSPST